MIEWVKSYIISVNLACIYLQESVLVLILETSKWSCPRENYTRLELRSRGQGGWQQGFPKARPSLPSSWVTTGAMTFAVQSRVSLWCVLISQCLPCVLLWDAEVRVQAHHAVQCGLIHRLSWLSTWLCKTTETHFEATDGLTLVFIWAVLEFHCYVSEYTGQFLFASVLPWAGK